jgi:non-lysosomal glucosylceramidase
VIVDRRGGSVSEPDRTHCCGGGCEPRPSVNRRRFLSLSAAAATAALLAARARAAQAAGLLPHTVLAPADKGLSPADLAALRERGAPTSYTGSDLRYLGLPVGGGCCGQVYLGGDGRLWYWEIDPGPAAPGVDGAGEGYANPHQPFSPFGNGAVLRTTAAGARTARRLDATGFADITFTGQYPIGQVDYHDPGCPVGVRLEAFSPFVPGEADDSTLPTTVLAYTLTNTSAAPVLAELTWWAENPVGLRARIDEPITLSSTEISGPDHHGVQFTAANATVPAPRPDIVLETWQQSDYAGWTVTGSAFGAGPVLVSEVPAYLLRFGDLHAQGPRFVTSHNFLAAGGDAAAADAYTGTLTSGAFTVSRRYLAAWVGGGNLAGQTCLNVVVDGRVVGSLTGDDTEPMRLRHVDLIRYQGRTATVEIVDSATGGWGHVNVSTISLTDAPANPTPIGQLTDGGTVGIAALVGPGLPGAPNARPAEITVRPSIADWSTPWAIADSGPGPAEIDGGLGTITGAVTARISLAPGESRTVRFAIAWYFPNPDRIALSFLTGIGTLRRHYANRFDSAQQVLAQLADQLPRLETGTREWVRTWYTDSTLPHWLLERTLITSATLASGACLRFTDGRFYAWEGVDCCAGTCEHVWNYAQGIARLFPELERDTRQRVDLGIGLHPDTGEIGNRAEADMGWAADGQCGTVLRIYREHQMAPDGGFLRDNWPRIKQAITWVMNQDARHDGTLEGPQPNTLDATWYGEVAWMTGLYGAALRAGVAMATEVGDTAFARTCQALADAGARSLATDLWTGEYFIQLIDPNAPDAVNSNIGCHIDQLFGQSLAWQLGLPRVFDREQTITALGNIVRYNFVPDAAAYRAANTAIPGGRWYAMAGEPAVIMTTFPHGGAAQANGNPSNPVAMYFNESWTGQEYQLAAHLIYEGLVDDGLAITRAVHNRYAAAKRNPFNEIECSEHYARAMAGYGVFLAVCGFSCHGPQGRLSFAPRFGAEDFAAAFTAAGGWGRYRQRTAPGRLTSALEVRHGAIRLSVLDLGLPADLAEARDPVVRLDLDGRPLAATVSTTTATGGPTVSIALAESVSIPAGGTLTATVRTR